MGPIRSNRVASLMTSRGSPPRACLCPLIALNAPTRVPKQNRCDVVIGLDEDGRVVSGATRQEFPVEQVGTAGVAGPEVLEQPPAKGVEGRVRDQAFCVPMVADRCHGIEACQLARIQPAGSAFALESFEPLQPDLSDLVGVRYHSGHGRPYRSPRAARLSAIMLLVGSAAGGAHGGVGGTRS